MLKGKKISPHVSLGVAPGSKQVMEMISRNGALGDIIAAGGRILESVCGFCIGNSMAPATDTVSVRTSNRNFFGRSGTESAQVFLVSPESAVASALKGEIVDPALFFKRIPYPKINLPKEFILDDSMISKPPKSGNDIEIVRGPNIGNPPQNEPCPHTINGVVTVKVGEKITTDHIMPAGSRLKYRSNIPKYSEFVFEREAPGFAAKALANKNNGIHNIIMAGESYGQGSSREHAAICPMYLGVKMVVAKSIERIHRDNLFNFGIIPAIFNNPADYDACSTDDQIVVENVRKALAADEHLILNNLTKKIKIECVVAMSARQKKNLIAGGLINATKSNK